MKKFITSDIHFSHGGRDGTGGILKFCPATRPYVNVDEMNEKLIHEWNSTVGPNDLTYILGDVAFCNAEDAAKILKRLNGKKILIAGNHDRKNLRNSVFVDCFESVHDYLGLKENGTFIVLFHFPILEWDQMHHGSVHFYGHIHGKVSGLEKYRARDVGVDIDGRVVKTLHEMITSALTGEIKTHH